MNKKILFHLLVGGALLLPAYGSAQERVVGDTSAAANAGPYQAYRTGNDTRPATQLYSRRAFLFRAHELDLPYGAVITELAWYKKKGEVPGKNEFRMWMHETDVGYFDQNSKFDWDTLITKQGVMPVYSSLTQEMLGAPHAYEGFTLDNPFSYKQGNLIVYTDFAIKDAFSVDNLKTTEFGNDGTQGMEYAIGIQNGAGFAAPGSSLMEWLFTGGARPAIRIRYYRPAMLDNAAMGKLVSPYVFCRGEDPEVLVEVKNHGTNAFDSVQINWELDGVLQQPFIYRNRIDTFGSTAGYVHRVSLGNVLFDTAARNFKVWTSLPNGRADVVNADDTLRFELQASLSGVYSVGGANPDYATPFAAMEAVNRVGVCGPVTFSIRNGTYYGEITNSRPVKGLEGDNILTFRSESGRSADVTIIGDSTTYNNTAVRLIFISNVHFRALSIVSLHSNGYATMHFNGNGFRSGIDGINIVVDSCLVSTNGAVSGAIAGSMQGIVEITNNTIKGNIGGVISSLHDSIIPVSEQRVLVRNNQIAEGGVSVYTIYPVKAVCSDNEIYNTVHTTGIAASGYYEVLRNRIVMLTEKGNVAGISLGVSSASFPPSLVANNTVLAGSGDNTEGIKIVNIRNGNVKVYHNTVVVQGTGNTNVAGNFIGTSAQKAPPVELRNNIFYNRTNKGQALIISDAAVTSSNYNNIYSASSRLVGNHANLDAWRNASGHDRNSVSYNPGLLHDSIPEPDPSAPAAWSVNGRGIHLAEVSADIRHMARPADKTEGAPDLGAYEFTPSSVPPPATALPFTAYAGSTQYFIFAADTVACIHWASGSPVPANLQVRQYSGEPAPDLGPGNIPRYMFFHVDVEGMSGTYDYQADIRYHDIWKGTITDESLIRMASRAPAAAWSFLYGTGSFVDISTNVISAPSLSGFASFTGTDTTGTTLCSGTVQQPDLDAYEIGLCLGSSIRIKADNPNSSSASPEIGYVFRWEESASGSAGWNPVSGGAGSSGLIYQTPGLSNTIWYRLKLRCDASGQEAFSDPVQVKVAEPGMVTGVASAARCGKGSLTISATAPAGDSLLWYTIPSGGSPVHTGGSFVTPEIAANTTYYVSASRNGACESERQPVLATVRSIPPAPVQLSGVYTRSLNGDLAICPGKSVVFTADTGTGYSWSWYRDHIGQAGVTGRVYEAQAPGSYHMVVTDANGCEGISGAFTVVNAPPPDPEITWTGTRLETGDFITYQWYYEGVPVAGAEDYFLIPDPGNGGRYTVSVTNEYDCEAVSDPYNWTLAVNETAAAATPVVYPNPVSGTLYISAAFPVVVRLTDLSGRTIREELNVSGKFSTESVPAGLYLLLVSDRDGNPLLNEKLVIEK